jgi:hypothetical protein
LQTLWSSPAQLEAQGQQVIRCTEIALSCMDMDWHKRPSILNIIDELNKTEKRIEMVTNHELDPSPSLASTSNVAQPAASPPPSTPSPAPSVIASISDVLVLDCDDIDITSEARDQFPENSKAEVCR